MILRSLHHLVGIFESSTYAPSYIPSNALAAHSPAQYRSR